jgi:hypothetical protein
MTARRDSEGGVTEFALATMAGITVPGLIPGLAMAVTAGNRDQYNDLLTGTIGAETAAQTFTAGRTGWLNDVELFLRLNGTARVEIQSTAGGKPTGTVLATSSATAETPDIGAWVDFEFKSPARVESGVMYAIVLTRPDGGFIVSGSANYDSYPGGQALENNGSSWVTTTVVDDLGFAMYVSASLPPTSTIEDDLAGNPASPLIPVAGLLGLCGGLLGFMYTRRRGDYRI